MMVGKARLSIGVFDRNRENHRTEIGYDHIHPLPVRER